MVKVVVWRFLRKHKIPLKEFARSLRKDPTNVRKSIRADANPRLETVHEWATTLSSITKRRVRFRDLIED